MFNRLNSPKLDALVSPDIAILLLRIGAAALVMTHGVPKLMRILGGNFGFGDPLGLGPEVSLFLVMFAEAICAFLILIGLWTRLAAVPLIINFIVVVFVAHAGDPFGSKELGLFFMTAFLTIFFTGAGKYSFDQLIGKGKRRY